MMVSKGKTQIHTGIRQARSLSRRYPAHTVKPMAARNWNAMPAYRDSDG